MKLPAHGLIGLLALVAACNSVPPVNDPRRIANDACVAQHREVSAVRRASAVSADLLRTAAIAHSDRELPAARRAVLLDASSSRPKSCVALSGGGQRAAAFAIGVLAGVHKSDPQFLPSSAYIAATSGGGYSLGWLMAHGARNGTPLEQLFAPDQAHQRRLSAASQRGAGNAMHTWSYGLMNFAAPEKYSYRGAQERNSVELEIPAKAAETYAFPIIHQFLDEPETFSIDARQLTLASVRDGWRRRHLPYPIWNITALPLQAGAAVPLTSGADGTSGFCPAARAAAFEWTLDDIGNSVHGYVAHDHLRSDSRSLDISAPMTTSGAALDNPLLGQRTLGAVITGVGSPGSPRLALPGSSDLRGSFWLLDGGFVDNISLVPLILRGCESILVVDAEHDPYLQFTAYSRAKQTLLEAFGLRLQVADIDSHLLQWRECPDATPVIDRWQWLPSSKKATERCAFAADRVSSWPVYRGNISFDTDGRPYSRVTYVKLAAGPFLSVDDPADHQTLRDFTLVRFFLERDRTTEEFGRNGCGIPYSGSFRCRFPQESTINQALPGIEPTAYPALGRLVGDWDAYVALGRLIGGRVVDEAK